MKSRLQVAGHPIHAMLVGFPIGLYTSSLVCDLLFALLREPFWFRAAFWAILFGLIGHVAAAAAGVPDFLAVMRERAEARRAASSHLVFGIGLLIVQGLNLALRHGGDLPPGGSAGLPLIVNLIASAVLGVQGWYGGELVYRHFVGVEIPEPAPAHQGGKHKAKH